MSDFIVVDASLGVKWVLDEPYSAQARTLLAFWNREVTALLAPALFEDEVANALFQVMRRGR